MIESRVRRALVAATAIAVTAGALTGCSEASSDGDTVTIDYGWWGGTESDENIFAAIDKFEAKNPDIKVEGEATPWNGYWDKLATMSAGKNAPDVMMMSERYIREYSDRGALADIYDIGGVDLEDLDESVLELGEVDDELYAMPTGVNSFVVAVNLDVFEAAGVEVPDDATWTWDDYYAASKATAGDGISGANYRIGIENFKPWLHQQGETMYKDDGSGIAFSHDTLKSYLQHIITQQENGGPSADQVSEEAGLPAEATAFATGKQSMSWIYTAELGAYSAGGANLKLMRIPSETGSAADAGMYLRGSSFYSISAYSDEREQKAAAKFIDFMVNDKDALEILGMQHGLPANAEVVSEISDGFSDVDKEVFAFVESMRPDLKVASPGPSPAGSGNIQGIFDRFGLEMLYGQLSVDEATDSILKAIDDELG